MSAQALRRDRVLVDVQLVHLVPRCVLHSSCTGVADRRRRFLLCIIAMPSAPNRAWLHNCFPIPTLANDLTGA